MVVVGSHLIKGCLEPNETVERGEMGPTLHTDVVVEDQSLVLGLGEESSLLGQRCKHEPIAIKASFHDYHSGHVATQTIGNGRIRRQVDEPLEVGELDAGLKAVGMFTRILIEALKVCLVIFLSEIK